MKAASDKSHFCRTGINFLGHIFEGDKQIQL